jgi:hypothetical protein
MEIGKNEGRTLIGFGDFYLFEFVSDLELRISAASATYFFAMAAICLFSST